jgi:hypothetical protein
MHHTRPMVLTLVGMTAFMSCAALAGEASRTYVSGNFFLTLEGASCGFVKSVDGGAISAEVISEPIGPAGFAKKHVGQPKYEEFTLQVGFSMASPVYDWIQKSWTLKVNPVAGSVVALDTQLAAKSERQFSHALITETTIPAMDGSSKEPAYMTIKFAPESTRTVEPATSKVPGELGKNEQKVFLPANFTLEIEGLDCSKVNKIDSFTVRQTVVTAAIGEARDSAKSPSRLEFPNLKIHLAEVAAKTWTDWHRTFVIEGRNDEKQEKSGTLTLLGTDAEKTVVAKIKFYNMGICSLKPEKAEANADQIRRVEAELYVERMEFVPRSLVIGGQTVAPATVPAATTAPRISG